MTPKEIIESIGEADVAEATKAKLNTVSHWKARGVPASHWPAIVEVAAIRGVPDVTFDLLKNATEVARSERRQ